MMRGNRKAALAVACAGLLLATACVSSHPGRRRNDDVLSTGRLVVRVTDHESRPIAGARVALTTPAGEPGRSAVTDEGGSATFSDLRPGRYSVRTQALGGAAARRARAVVRAGEETGLYVILESSSVDTVRVRPKGS